MGNGSHSLLSDHGKFLCAEQKTGKIVADRQKCLEWEHFKFFLAENQFVAFETARGKFLSVAPDNKILATGYVCLYKKKKQFFQ